jgi:hypothetical protein
MKTKHKIVRYSMLTLLLPFLLGVGGCEKDIPITPKSKDLDQAIACPRILLTNATPTAGEL